MIPYIEDMTNKDWKRISRAIADVLCWHSGFEAAFATTEGGSPDGPYNLSDLKDFKTRLDQAIIAKEASS